MEIIIGYTAYRRAYMVYVIFVDIGDFLQVVFCFRADGPYI